MLPPISVLNYRVIPIINAGSHSPAAIFEEMAALMAPCPPGGLRFRCAAPCGASLGGGPDDSAPAQDEGGAGEEVVGDVLGLASSSDRGDPDPR